MPLAANSFGWIFTEMGRQPWAVFGLMTTENAVSPGVSVGEALTSLVVLTAAVRRARRRRGRAAPAATSSRGADPFVEPPDPTCAGRATTDDEPLTFAY